MKVMPAASSQAAVQQQDAIADEEGMDSNALANRAQGDGAEGSVFEEQHLALQAETKGNMHVCMIQGPCLESESLFIQSKLTEAGANRMTSCSIV